MCSAEANLIRTSLGSRRPSRVKIVNHGDINQAAHDRNLLYSERISTDSVCVSAVVPDVEVRIRLRPCGIITRRERISSAKSVKMYEIDMEAKEEWVSLRDDCGQGIRTGHAISYL